MTYTQTFSAKTDYLLCVTTGEVVDADGFIAWGEGVIAHALKAGHKRILLDNREFLLKVSAMDIVTFAKHLENQDAVHLGLRLAVIPSPANPEMSRTVETSMTNRSATYRRFGTKEEAEAWLRA